MHFTVEYPIDPNNLSYGNHKKDFRWSEKDGKMEWFYDEWDTVVAVIPDHWPCTVEVVLDS